MSFKASELRIGNLLIDSRYNEIHFVSGNTIDSLQHLQGMGILNPIQLTKEMALQLGFKKIKYSPYSYELGDCSINIKDFIFCIDVSEDFDYCIDDVRYVHRLQNIYFAFKNEELIYRNTTK